MSREIFHKLISLDLIREIRGDYFTCWPHAPPWSREAIISMFTCLPTSAKLPLAMYKKGQYLEVIARAKEKLASVNIEERAAARGFRIAENGALEMPFFTDRHILSLPGLELARPNGRPASRILQAVALHHLLAEGGAPLSGRFIPFREMPGLSPYQATIKWRVLDVLVRAFGGNPALLHSILLALGGKKLNFGDASALFWALPQVPIHVVVWGEDEIEPPAAAMMFDESVTTLLPLEDIVVLGELAAHRLKAETLGAGAEAETEKD